MPETEYLPRLVHLWCSNENNKERYKNISVVVSRTDPCTEHKSTAHMTRKHSSNSNNRVGVTGDIRHRS